MDVRLPPALSAWSRYSDLHLRIAFMGRPIDLNIVSVSLAVLAILAVSRFIKFRANCNAMGALPVLHPPFAPFALPGAAFPSSWWNLGIDFTLVLRSTLYRARASETVAVVPWLAGGAGLYTANLDVARQVAAGGTRSLFIKPESASRALLLWGMNLVAAEGDVWRKHRRIMAPAFNPALYALVWEQTLAIYREMLAAEGWAGRNAVTVPAVQGLTFKLALLVLGGCAFGFPFSWAAPPVAPDGTMPVQEAISVVADSSIFAVSAPRWAWWLPFRRIRRIRAAHKELAAFMRTQVAARKAELAAQGGGGGGRRDAFSMLVQANEQEGDRLRLDDAELIGNVFIMLFAGHETTAHTLAATLGLLAIHEEIQEEIVKQIHTVVGPDADPAFADYAKLDKVLSAFYEAIRLFPSGYVMIREAVEDTVLTLPNPVGVAGSRTIPVPKGMQVTVDMIGLQHNPRYFEAPEEFRPGRWAGRLHEAEAFTAFSVGPRACIGRQFATTEAVCFLTMLLREWRVAPLLAAGETAAGWRARVLQGRVMMTLGVRDVPLRLTRRERAA